MAFEDRKIAVVQPDAVRRGRGLVKQAQLFKISRGRHAVTRLAFFVLALGLGQVHMHMGARLRRVLCHSLDHLGRGRVLAVDAQINLEAALARVLIACEQVAVVMVGRRLLVVAVIKHGQATAQVALDAGLQDGVGHGLAEEIHIGKRYRAKAQHLCDGQPGRGRDGCVAEFVLKREDALIEPAL